DPSLRREADRRRSFDDDGTEAQREADLELLERDVDDAAEDRGAFLQPHDADRVRRVGGVTRRRDADDRVARERAFAGERHHVPRARAAARAELLRRNRDLAAAAALDPREASRACAVDEALP